MKKYTIVSISLTGFAVSLLFGISAASAASLTSTVGANINSAVTATALPVVTASSGANVNLGSGTYNSSVNADGNENTSGASNSNANINIGSGDPQLTTYAQSIAASDASISAISTTDSNTSISYKVPVELFGFIPVHETETASVDMSTTGTPQVSVHRSWWSFLASGNSSSDAQAFSSTLSAQMNSSTVASNQANILAEIEVVAQSRIGATENSNASASTSY